MHQLFDSAALITAVKKSIVQGPMLFVLDRPFQPSLMFVSKAGAYTSEAVFATVSHNHSSLIFDSKAGAYQSRPPYRSPL